MASENRLDFDPSIGKNDVCYLYKSVEDGKVRCFACEHRCLIPPGRTGICGIRKNDKGILRQTTYSYLSSLSIDPIEKKPLYHVLPGVRILSLAPVGCNFTCSFCQNWHISQVPLNARGGDGVKDIEEEMGIRIKHITPKEVANRMKENGLRSIAFTYNEPGISFEYNYAVLREIAKSKGEWNDENEGTPSDKKHVPIYEPTISVYVTNGFETPEQWELLKKAGLSAVNIDLKAFTDTFYRKICGGRLEPVKASIKKTYELGIHTEVTTLLVPGENDDEKELKELANFLASVSPDIPWHISAFHPDYRMTEKIRTPLTTIEKAVKIGQEAGLHFVYMGNVSGDIPTMCPKCHKELVTRKYFAVKRSLVTDEGKCPDCGEKIYGIWK